VATPEQWLAKLARLKVDRATGDPAPHKPLLLLIVIDLADEGILPHDVLPLTPELAFQFATYWGIVAHRRNQPPDVRLPFHHLQSDGFWSAQKADGQPSTDNRETRFANIPYDFGAAARDPAWRSTARRILIAKYFRPAERMALYGATGLPIPTEDEVRQDAAYKSSEEAMMRGREARFRLTIVAAYNYACALTGLRLTTITVGSIVDAAHIHQFADSRNNQPQNGLALCKNAHWMFDQGLWTIADDYRILVGIDRFSESAPDGKLFASYHGQRLHLPSDDRLHPSRIHLAWHRRKHGYGSTIAK
jgi:putative restriction endonuclease